MSCGIWSGFGAAAWFWGTNGESRAARVSEYVAGWSVFPTEGSLEVDSGSPWDGETVNSCDGAIWGITELGGLVLSAGDANGENADDE